MNNFKCHKDVASDFLKGKSGAFLFILPHEELGGADIIALTMNYGGLRGMSQLERNIAVNLKRIRKSKNMSLDMLSERTGVSKSMLGQIERGESNPTVATIAKIVEGMHVPFEELIYPKNEAVVIIDNDKQPVYREQEGVYLTRPIFPYARHRGFEAYEVRIEPGQKCESFLHNESGCEYIMVMQGTLTLKTEESTYEIAPNHTVQICSEGGHSYLNRGESLLVINVFSAA